MQRLIILGISANPYCGKPLPTSLRSATFPKGEGFDVR